MIPENCAEKPLAFLPFSPTQFMQIIQHWFSWQKSPLPSLPCPVHVNSFNFGSAGRKAPSKFIQLFGSAGRKAPSLSYHFMRDYDHITHVEYPRSPYYKSILRFLLSEYLL